MAQFTIFFGKLKKTCFTMRVFNLDKVSIALRKMDFLIDEGKNACKPNILKQSG